MPIYVNHNMGEFRNIVTEYSNRLQNRIILSTRYPDEKAFEIRILFHKVVKHYNNPAKIAIYVAMYLQDYWPVLITPSERLKGVLRIKGIKLSLEKKIVSYPHEDGTAHYVIWG